MLKAPLLHQDHAAPAVYRGERPSRLTLSWAEKTTGEDLLPGQCKEKINSPAFGDHSSSRRGKLMQRWNHCAGLVNIGCCFYKNWCQVLVLLIWSIVYQLKLKWDFVQVTLKVLYVTILKGVESFLHKDVSFVVTGNQECLKEQKCTDTKAGAKGTSEEAQHPIMRRESVLNNDKRRPGTPRPMVLSITHTCSKIFYCLQRCWYLNIDK